MYNIEDIKEQFKKVIAYSQGINIKDINVDDLFEKWYIAKKSFIDAFQGRLIVELPEKVSCELSPKERERRLSEFIEVVELYYENPALARFISDNRSDFYKNIISCNYETIQKGSKLIKAYKNYESDKEALERIQNHASRLIQENTIEGYLCISVHPLDFLSASENAHNWRSCHALDGEFRSGNLSYMVDECTTMCYLKSDDKLVSIPRFPQDVPWNSKRWRMWLYFSTDRTMMFAGRQYPFEIPYLLDFHVRRDLLETARLNFSCCWEYWNRDKIKNFPHDRENHLYSPYVGVGTKLLQMDELIIDMPGSNHYNDLLRSSVYDPVYSYLKDMSSFYCRYGTVWSTNAETTRFKLGGAVKCLICGKEDIYDGESMLCAHCEEKYSTVEDSDSFGYCACCGTRVYHDYGFWTINDDLLCFNCHETEATYCENCHNLFYNEDIVYNRERSCALCEGCNDSVIQEKISMFRRHYQ